MGRGDPGRGNSVCRNLDPAVFSWEMPFRWLKKRDQGGEMGRAQIL